MTFAQLLNSYLTEKDMSVQELAYEANLTVVYIRKVLRGKHTPSKVVALEIAAALKLSLPEQNQLLESLD